MGPVDLGGGFGEITGLTGAGDVTGDGFPDLLGMSGGALAVFPGTGTGISPGRMVAARTVARTGLPTDLSPFDWVIPVSDIKGAGAADYLIRQASTGYLYVFTGTRSGVAPPRWLGEGLGAYDLAG